MIFYLEDEKKTQEVARIFAFMNLSSLIVTFRGQIGAGKTTFIRSALRALGVKNAIKSPTFSIVESYTIPDFTIHHFDLYRIINPEELEFIGFRDYFTATSLCLIEWPEKAKNFLPHVDIEFKFDFYNMGRKLEIASLTCSGEKVVKNLAKKINVLE